MTHRNWKANESWQIGKYSLSRNYKNEKGWIIKEERLLHSDKAAYFVYPSVESYAENSPIKHFQSLLDAQAYVAQATEGGFVWDYSPSIRSGVTTTLVLNAIGMSTLLLEFMLGNQNQAAVAVGVACLVMSGTIGSLVTRIKGSESQIQSQTPRWLIWSAAVNTFLVIALPQLQIDEAWRYTLLLYGIMGIGGVLYMKAVNEELSKLFLLVVNGEEADVKEAETAPQVRRQEKRIKPTREVAPLYQEMRAKLLSNAQAAAESQNARWKHEAQVGLRLLDECTQQFIRRAAPPLEELKLAYEQIERIATENDTRAEEAERAWKTQQAYLQERLKNELEI